MTRRKGPYKTDAHTLQFGLDFIFDIDADRKWQPFPRRYIQMDIVELKCISLD